jgi:hypothetical protein
MTAQELRESCRALDIDWPVTLAQLKAARNLQAQVWHPDRFHHNERLRLEAEGKLKRVNVAFERMADLLQEGKTWVCNHCQAPVTALKQGVCAGCSQEKQPKARPKTPRPRRGTTERTERRQHVDIHGRWQSQSGWVEFAGTGRSYQYTDWGLLGQVGDGTALVSGNSVTMRGRNVLFGTYELSLVVNGAVMIGAINYMGVPVPVQLWRV